MTVCKKALKKVQHKNIYVDIKLMYTRDRRQHLCIKYYLFVYITQNVGKAVQNRGTKTFEV